MQQKCAIQWLAYLHVVVAILSQFATAVDEGIANKTVHLLLYKPPAVNGLHFAETFDGDVWGRWTISTRPKYEGKWKVENRKVEALVGDLGLHCPDPAQHYGISANIPPVQMHENGTTFLIQFEAQRQDGLSCGGSYIKLFDRGGSSPQDYDDTVPYVIMFGPDRCGSTDKVHFILRHQNPVTGNWEEKHLKQPPEVPNNNRTHLYGLLIQPDNYFEVIIDGKVKASGSLLEDMEPPINPPAQIDDPSDKKPVDWVEMRLIEDPEAKKPDDWGDESEPEGYPDPDAKKPEGWLDRESPKIPDPDAKKPDDWNDEEDGTWEPNMIDNPACTVGCGIWYAPMVRNPKFVGRWDPPLIDNPEYKGPWFPRQIDNPAFFEDKQPALFPPINAIGFDIWTMQGGLFFDNIVISLGNLSLARSFASQSFDLRREIEEIQDPPAPEPELDWFEKGGLLGWIERNPKWSAVGSWTLLINVLIWLCCPGVYTNCRKLRRTKTECTADSGEEQGTSESADKKND